MAFYSDSDYLCNESFFIQGIGHLKCPTLREARKVTFNVFFLYISLISYTLEDYLKLCGLHEQYNVLSETEKQLNSLFHLLLYGNTSVLFGIISTFIADEFIFDENELVFKIYRVKDDSREQIGHIGADNFDKFREELQYILGTKTTEEHQQRFKNKLAQKMYEKMQRHAKEQSKKVDENMSFDNMIKKYCTHNKVGINILNVWDLTYYQFVQMFKEYCNGRQYDFNDMMAANTFSYKKSSDYNPQAYMSKLKNN